VKDEFKGGIKEILKDAPLPVRMMGSMISPLMSNMVSNLAETMSEQQQSVDDVMNDAKTYLYGDDAVQQTLGEPISVAPTPFSQGSSTSSINGKTTTRIELGFQVSGSRQNGIARAIANQDGIQQLTLDVGGRVLNVSLSKRGIPSSKGGGGGRNKFDDDNVIEAEIIEKNTK